MSFYGARSGIVVMWMFSLAGSACDKKEEEEEPVAIPSVSMTCKAPATACSDNRAHEQAAIIYWSNTICRDSNSAAQIKAGNDAPVDCDNGVCSASVSSWFTFDGEPVTKLDVGTYVLCGGVDLDGDNTLNQAGEPVAIKSGVVFEDGIGAQVLDTFEDQE